MTLTTARFLKDIASKYNISIELVIDCLKDALEKSGNYGKLYSEFYGEKLYFYELIYNRFNEFRKQEVRIRQNTYQGILDNFMQKVTEESIKSKNKELLNILKNCNGIIEGKITNIKRNGLEVLTRYGYAFCPNRNIFIKDLKTKTFKEGQRLYFHLSKFRFQGKDTLILDRKHISILRKEAQEIMKDCEIYHIERDIGKEVFVYCAKKPSIEQIKALVKMANAKVKIELRT